MTKSGIISILESEPTGILGIKPITRWVCCKKWHEILNFSDMNLWHTHTEPNEFNEKNNVDVKRAGPDVCEEEKEETWDSGFIRFSWEGSGGENFMVWLQSWSFHTYLSMSVGLFYYCWDSIWRHRNHFTELTDLETYSCVSRKVLLFYHVYIQYQCALWDTSAKCSDVIGQMCSCSNYNKNNNMIYCANTCVIDISGHTAQH